MLWWIMTAAAYWRRELANLVEEALA